MTHVHVPAWGPLGSTTSGVLSMRVLIKLTYHKRIYHETIKLLWLYIIKKKACVSPKQGFFFFCCYSCFLIFWTLNCGWSCFSLPWSQLAAMLDLSTRLSTTWQAFLKVLYLRFYLFIGVSSTFSFHPILSIKKKLLCGALDAFNFCEMRWSIKK